MKLHGSALRMASIDRLWRVPGRRHPDCDRPIPGRCRWAAFEVSGDGKLAW